MTRTEHITDSDIHSIFPYKEVKERIGKDVVLTQVGLSQYAEIVGAYPADITGLALNAWNRIAHGKNPPKDKYAVKEWITIDHRQGTVNIDPAIVAGISDIIGTPLIKDISFSEVAVTDEAVPTENRKIARLIVARVHPNDVILADIFFQDPGKSIPEKDQYQWQVFKGFGLLGTVVSRTNDYAKAHRCDYLTLTASADDLVPLFAKHGFALETNEFGRQARAMQRRVR